VTLPALPSALRISEWSPPGWSSQEPLPSGIEIRFSLPMSMAFWMAPPT
jgi:hypothetical protein